MSDTYLCPECGSVVVAPNSNQIESVVCSKCSFEFVPSVPKANEEDPVSESNASYDRPNAISFVDVIKSSSGLLFALFIITLLSLTFSSSFGFFVALICILAAAIVIIQKYQKNDNSGVIRFGELIYSSCAIPADTLVNHMNDWIGKSVVVSGEIVETLSGGESLILDSKARLLVKSDGKWLFPSADDKRYRAIIRGIVVKSDSQIYMVAQGAELRSAGRHDNNGI